jgi:hypothetical protein
MTIYEFSLSLFHNWLLFGALWLATTPGGKARDNLSRTSTLEERDVVGSGTDRDAMVYGFGFSSQGRICLSHTQARSRALQAGSLR